MSHFIHVFFSILWDALGVLTLVWIVVAIVRLRPATRRPWYSPSGWASSLVYMLAMKLESGSDLQLLVSGFYGVLEVSGISGLIKLWLERQKRRSVDVSK